MNPETSSSKGPLVGTIVVLVLLVLGALYFVGPATPKESVPAQDTQPVSAAPSDEDEISSINSDFASLDVDAAAADIAQYEGEVEAQ